MSACRACAACDCATTTSSRDMTPTWARLVVLHQLLRQIHRLLGRVNGLHRVLWFQ